MSKQIKPGALDEFDRQYLTDRGINPDDFTDESTPAEAEAVEEEDVPYSEWTKDELKTELRNRRLIVSGSHAELVARLEDHDAGRVASEADDDDSEA